MLFCYNSFDYKNRLFISILYGKAFHFLHIFLSILSFQAIEIPTERIIFVRVKRKNTLKDYTH